MKTILDFSPSGLTPSCDLSGSNTYSAPATFDAWPSKFSSIISTLQHLANATEHDFLQIGSQMQGINQRTNELSETASQLVEAASGEHIRSLMGRLHQMLQDMETYLARAQKHNFNSATNLELIGNLLKQVAEPLDGFKKMSRQLYILEVSVKIESTYLGEMGSEFLNLAQDIKKLSHQIKEKANTVNEHRFALSTMIRTSITDTQTAKTNQDSNLQTIMRDTATSLTKLELANESFSILGGLISSVAMENSDNISGIVQSMQFQDMYRQQLEHVIEAIEELISSHSSTHSESQFMDELSFRKVVSNTGNVCELQEAQLQFASAELYSAVTSIVNNLGNISLKQQQIGQDIDIKVGGIKKTANGSFIADVGRHMSSITNLLTDCVYTNKQVAGITSKVSSSVGEITGFVSDIEDISHEITQIALNSRIKAAYTGEKGASLAALSEEVGQLSHDAVRRSDRIAAILTEIQSATERLSAEAENNEKLLDIRLSAMKDELKEILNILDDIGKELFYLLPQIQHKVSSLTGEIEKISGNIDVHKRVKIKADEVLDNLRQIFKLARETYPASAEFKEDLRRMSGLYTMESERRVHDNIARKHTLIDNKAEINPTTSGSEFVDNVDLF